MVGSIRFSAYSNDHLPRHVHGYYEEVLVIVDLLDDGNVDLADRSDPIRPAGAKKSAIRKILRAAGDNYDALTALWEKAHEG